MENIFVAVRFRPLSASEQAQLEEIMRSEKFKSSMSSEIWRIFPEENTILNTRTKQSFTYDRVFPEWSSNEDVFENIAKPLVFNALNGVNSTIFAYGQTSSGKTFTIRGNAENPGIIPLTVREIFEVIRSRTDREYCLKVSYLEVYNEQVNDLLDPSKTNLDIRERLDKGVYVERLSEYTISSYDEAIRLLVTGEANRKIGETSMNVQSSRSHTVFRISIESTGPHDDGKILMSQLNLVDLAGSEGVQQTKAENLRLREGSNINKSLLSLSTVIQKLSEAGGKGGAFVNYRDSKMTRLLQPALSGNSKTSVVCNVTPAITFFQETNNTLQFGAKAKRIKTNAKVNEVMNSESHLKTMQDELKKLQGRVEELNEILGNKNLELQRIREQETEKDSYHFAIVEKIENDNENLKQALIEKELQLKELQSRILNSGRPSQASWTTPASCEERRSRVQSSLIKSRKIKHNQAIETNDYIEALESLVMERDDTISKLQNELKNIKLNYEDKFQQLLMESEMFSEEIQNHCEPFDISSLQDTINSLELEKASLLFQLDELSIHKDRQLETISQENSVLKENINLLNNKIEEHTRRDQILELTKLERDYQNLMNVLDSKEIERAERESLINNLSEKCSILMEKFEAETRKTHDYELQIQETKNEFAKYVNMELELREMKDMAMAAIGHVENQQNINHQLKEDHQKDLEKLESELRYIYEYNEKQQNQHKDSYNNLELQLNTELSKNHALENELQLIRIKYAEEVECLNLKIMSLTNDIKILIEENARINEKVTDCTQDLKSENEKLLNINCEMETQIKVLNQDKSGFQQQIYSLEINIKDLNTENSLLLSKITETQSRATDQFNFLNDVTGLLEQTQAEISQLKIEKSEFEALYTTSQAQLDELSDLLARVSEEKDKLESENAEAKQSFEEISSKKEFAETQLSEVKQAYEQLIAENSSIVIKLEELEQSHGNNNFDNLQTKLDHYMQENSSLNQNLIEKDIENSKLKEDFYKFQQETLNKSNEKYKGRISDLRGQIDHWKSQAELHDSLLNELKESLDSERTKLKAVLTQAEKENADLSHLMEAKQKLITQQEEEITVLKRRNSYKRLQSDLMDETMRKAIIESERHELNKEIQDAEFKTQCAEEDLAKFKKSYDALRIDNEMLIQNCKILTKQKRELEFNLRSLEEDFAEMKAELQILKRIQEQQTPDDVMPRKRGEKKKGFLPSELKNRLRDKKEVKQRDSDMSQVCENQ